MAENFSLVTSECFLVNSEWLQLIANSIKGLQCQLEGLGKFCSNNHTILNNVKTKCMAFGGGTISLFFNGKQIEQVDRYKYLGTILRSVKRANQDIFTANYVYLCDQARKAIFGAQRKIKGLGVTPPHIKLYLFDSLIKPILLKL